MHRDLFFLWTERHRGRQLRLGYWHHRVIRDVVLLNLSTPLWSAYGFSLSGHRTLPAPLGVRLQVLGKKKKIADVKGFL